MPFAIGANAVADGARLAIAQFFAAKEHKEHKENDVFFVLFA